MKKTIITFLTLISLSILTVIIFLSTKGYETDKFNQFILREVKKAEPKVDINLKKIKIQLDLKNLDLFLSTNNPKITYQEIDVPISQLKIYLDFLSLIQSKLYIKRIILFTDELNISDFQKLAIRIKPSNFKSFILNSVSEGKIKSNFDLNLNKDLALIDYKINGYLKKININFKNKIKIKNTNFNFIADKKLILINSISANFLKIPIVNGNIDIKRDDDLIISGSLNTELDSDEKKIREIISEFVELNFLKNKIEIYGNFLHKFNLHMSNSLELKDYDYSLTGKLDNTKIDFNNPFQSSFLKNKITKLNLNKTNLKINLNQNEKNKIFMEGIYSFNDNISYSNYKVENDFKKSNFDFNLNLDFKEHVNIKLINYEKNKDKTANITSKFNLINKEININNINYKEGKNLISLNGIEINKKNQLKKFKNIKVKTFKKDKENNNFEINFGKKITIKGKSYDSTNLIQSIEKKNNNNLFGRISKEIKISFENIFTKLSIPLNNFNLIGKIEKGKFIKISSKSEFEENQYLDISLKKETNTNKKVLEIYSGFAKPLLADFAFFKGIEGGQLLFTSIFDDSGSSSNLQIKNFKVLNAPAFAKLLALADLRGPEVLLSGKGLEFESLEIKFTDNNKIRKIKEIYAVGPSITILMDGYIENKSGLTSLRGTMVPAKEINKLISKIPVLGDILIGKEIGEGVFGVSFKMKGLPGKIKTTVNPIKTLTPRFITRTLEKKKKKNNK